MNCFELLMSQQFEVQQNQIWAIKRLEPILHVSCRLTQPLAETGRNKKEEEENKYWGVKCPPKCQRTRIWNQSLYWYGSNPNRFTTKKKERTP